MNLIYKKYIKIKEKGFTMVETLVAITILMISIVGPLTIASKSLLAAVYARDQVIATFLAQEQIENLKGLRNDMVYNEVFNTWADGLMQSYNSLGYKRYYIKNGDGRYIVDGTGSSDKQSRFSRKIVISKISNDEYTVSVTVKWDNGKIENQITLTDSLFNIQL